MTIPWRAAIAAAIVAATVGAAKLAQASLQGAVYIHSPASATVRLRVSEGPGAACDSNLNEMRFDGEILAGETLRVPFAGPCVCVSNTTTAFPAIDWSQGQRYCSPARRSSRAPAFSVELSGR